MGRSKAPKIEILSILDDLSRRAILLGSSIEEQKNKKTKEHMDETKEERVSQDDLIQIIRNAATCSICASIQIPPKFVTICGGHIMHASCAQTWFATKPTKDLYNQPLKHRECDPAPISNDLFEMGLKCTNMYDEELKELVSDINSSKFILQHPRLKTTFSPNLIRECVLTCLAHDPSTIESTLCEYYDVLKGTTKEQTSKIPIMILLEHPKLINLFDLDMKHIEAKLYLTLQRGSNTKASSLVLKNPELKTKLSPNLICECVLTCLTHDPSIVIDVLDEYQDALIYATKEQISKIPINIIVDNPQLVSLFDLRHIKKHIEDSFLCALNRHHDDNTACEIYTTLLLDSPFVVNDLYFLTACKHHPNLAIQLAQNPHTNIFCLSENGNTALMLASSYKHYVLVNHLLEHFAHNTRMLNHINTLKHSALTQSVNSGNIDAIKLLISNTFNLDIHYTDHQNHTVLSWATLYKHWDIVDLITQNYCRCDESKTLDTLCSYTKAPKIHDAIHNFIQRYPNIKFRPYIYNKLMHFAVIDNITPLLEFLMKNRMFDPNYPYIIAPNHEGQTLLQYAIRMGLKSLFDQMLSNKRTNPNLAYDYEPPLTLAYDNPSMFTKLVRDTRIDLNIVSPKYNKTAFMMVVVSQKFEQMCELLDQPNLDPTIRNADGFTASQIAAQSGCKSIYEYFRGPLQRWFIKTHGELALSSVLDHRSFKNFKELMNHPEFVVRLGYPLPAQCDMFNFQVESIFDLLMSPHVIVKEGPMVDLIRKTGMFPELLKKRLSRHFGMHQKHQECRKYNGCGNRKCAFTHPLCKHGFPISRAGCAEYHTIDENKKQCSDDEKDSDEEDSDEEDSDEIHDAKQKRRVLVHKIVDVLYMREGKCVDNDVKEGDDSDDSDSDTVPYKKSVHKTRTKN